MRGFVWTLRGVPFGRTWTLGTNRGARHGSTEVLQIQFIGFVVVEAELEYIIMRQTTETDYVLFLGFARAGRTWKNWCIILLHLVSGSFFSVCGCCMWTAERWIFREMTLSVAQCLV